MSNQDLSNTDKLRLRPSPAIDRTVTTLDQPGEPTSAEKETATFDEKLQSLLNDLAKQQNYAEAILENISIYTADLTFPVPAEATEVRSALLALEMDPEKVSYQDYVQLLRLQLGIATQIAEEQVS